jgi:tetratricopeptide (TPR) repeat protein
MSLAPHLARLEASGLISLATVEPEIEYLFRHALVQDAAYASLLKADRRTLHRAVGEALERLYPDRLDELSGLLAHHFALADNRDKAVAYSRRAAREAESKYAYEEAIRHLRTALDLFPPDDPTGARLTLLEELADDHRLLAEFVRAISTYQAALDLWKVLGDVDARRVVGARLHRKVLQTVTDMKWNVASVEQFEAPARAAEASRVALESTLPLVEGEPQPEIVSVLTALAHEAFWVRVPPDWEAAESYLHAAVDKAEQLDTPVELSEALRILAIVQYSRGQLREYMQTSLRRLELSRDPGFGNLRARLNILLSFGRALVSGGEYAQALSYFLEAESLADHLRAAGVQVDALAAQSHCWLRLDRWDEMSRVDEKRRALEERYPRDQVGPTCLHLGLNAAVRALRGEGEQAKALREEVYAIMLTADGPVEKWERPQHY